MNCEDIVFVHALDVFILRKKIVHGVRVKVYVLYTMSQMLQEMYKTPPHFFLLEKNEYTALQFHKPRPENIKEIVTN